MSNKRFGWRQALLDEDVTKIWNELYRLVYLHPLVQAARNSGMLGHQQYGGHSYTDLTQELFLTLFQKGRFEHYIDTKMTDREVEHEISQIELTNLLVAHLRRQHPESYRLARRISTLIQANAAFRRFDTLHVRDAATARRRGLTEKVYGLAAWPDQKEIKERARLEELILQVPMRVRNTREAGCTADSQIVISNADLLQLINNIIGNCLLIALTFTKIYTRDSDHLLAQTDAVGYDGCVISHEVILPQKQRDDLIVFPQTD